MDRQHPELLSMGFFGTYKESCKITTSWKKIFSQIFLILILPVSILYLSQMQISNFIRNKAFRQNKTSRLINFAIYEFFYIVLFLIFSILSTSVVSYTIACIYNSKEITFKKVFKVVPKVWKGLLVTSFLSSFIVLVYTGVAIGLMFLLVALVALGSEGKRSKSKALIVIICLSIPYFIGLAYINAIVRLASVISILERSCGTKAFKKSMNLIKGKIWVSCAIFAILEIYFVGIVVAFSILVVNEKLSSMGDKVGVGILCYLLLSIYFHFSLVIQTIVYFVCKSFHNEDIDLAKHLDDTFIPLTRDNDEVSV